jgi:hypothetical protein
MAVNDDDAPVRLALEELTQRQPHLRDVVDLLAIASDGEVQLTEEFMRWHTGKSETTTAGSTILRVLFADTSVIRRPLLDSMTPALARRIVAFLEAMPECPLAAGQLTPVNRPPKPLSSMFGLKSCTLGNWLDAALFPALWAHATGQQSAAIPGWAGTHVSTESLDALMPLLSCRILGSEVATALLAKGLTPPAGNYYFSTPSDALNVRNMAVYLWAIFDSGKRNGREQNQLPLQLARRFNIPTRSVPDSLAALDVLALAFDGLLESPTSDPMQIGIVFELAVPGGRDGFWEPAISKWRDRNIIHRSEQLCAEGDDGMFDSSLRYNVARATGLVEGRRARLQRFAPYYEAVSAASLFRIYGHRWRAMSPSVRRRVESIASNPTLTDPGIRLRDLCNIIARSELLPMDEHGLPSVALFALGMAEPEYSGQGSRQARPRRARSGKPSTVCVLDRFLKKIDARASTAVAKTPSGPGVNT